MRNKTASRLRTIYYMRTIEGKKPDEIAEDMGVSRWTVRRAVRIYRKICGLTDQDNTDLINFYEDEKQKAKANRASLSPIQHRLYIQYTNLIIEIEDKIAELLKLKNSMSLNIDNSKHEHKLFVQVYVPEPYPRNRIEAESLETSSRAADGSV